MSATTAFPTTIRLVAFDVDGVFTDGRFYLSNDGIESKAFSTQDGFGIRALIDNGINVAVISGRRSPAVSARMQELGVRHVIQGCKDKVAAFEKIRADVGVELEQSAFVGDDVPDLPLLRHVALSIAVGNAVPAVKKECLLTTRALGGHGAEREACEVILQRAAPGDD